MSEQLLNKPVWNALGGAQSRLSQCNSMARRFLPIYGPLCAGLDALNQSRDALGQLEIDENGLWVFDETEYSAPFGYSISNRAKCLQMIARTPKNFDIDLDYCDLTDDDAADMLALAQLTKPGPFSTHTHKLGNFIGLKQGGRLIAMAGERLRVGKYTEVSGVCTHPDFRGRGLAKTLIKEVMNRSFQKGEVPFLHSYADNKTAIALYESLGFEARAIVNLTILERK